MISLSLLSPSFKPRYRRPSAVLRLSPPREPGQGACQREWPGNTPKSHALLSSFLSSFFFSFMFCHPFFFLGMGLLHWSFDVETYVLLMFWVCNYISEKSAFSFCFHTSTLPIFQASPVAEAPAFSSRSTSSSQAKIKYDAIHFNF